jgi:hypothetical protein
MSALMMHVRDVGMPVCQPAMPMDVRVRLPRRIVGRVLMVVMGVVHMRMRMLHRLVRMGVLMTLGQVEPHANAHRQPGDGQLERRRIARKRQSGDRAQERGGREVGTGACCTEVPEREDRQRQADTVAEEAEQSRERAKGYPR